MKLFLISIVLLGLGTHAAAAVPPLPAICGEGVTAPGTPLPTPAAADATAGADVTGTHAAAAVPPLPAICGEGVTAAGTPLATPAAADATAGAGVTGTHAAAAVPPMPAVDGAEPAVGGTVLAVCDTEPEPAAGGTAPAVGGTIGGGTPPAILGGSRQAIIPSGGVQIGQELIGHCSRNKPLNDNKRCKVLRILTNEYVVEMLEGPKIGNIKRYKHENTKQPAKTTINLEDIWGASFVASLRRHRV